MSGVDASPACFTPWSLSVAVVPVTQQAAATHRVNYFRYKVEDYF